MWWMGSSWKIKTVTVQCLPTEFIVSNMWEHRPVRAQPQRKLREIVKNVLGAPYMGRSLHSCFGKFSKFSKTEFHLVFKSGEKVKKKSLSWTLPSWYHISIPTLEFKNGVGFRSKLIGQRQQLLTYDASLPHSDSSCYLLPCLSYKSKVN